MPTAYGRDEKRPTLNIWWTSELVRSPEVVNGRSYETGCQVRRSGRASGVWGEGEQAGGSGDRPLSYSRIGTSVHGFARRLPLTNSGGSGTRIASTRIRLQVSVPFRPP